MAENTSNAQDGVIIPTEEEELISKAYKLFDEFRAAYESEWERLNDNEVLYLGRHWDDMGGDANDPRPMTPVINSTIENIQADLIDNYPQAIIQPETPEDREVSEIINALIRQNHDAMGYIKEYRDVCHDVLTGGYGVQEVGYDTKANNGLGGAFIRYVDNHTILFDPQTCRMQEGRAVFKISPRTIVWLEQRYPDKVGQFKQDEFSMDEDTELKYDATKSVLMLEYWFKEYDEASERWRVHMCLLAGKQLLEDSRTEKPEGYFSLGEYPFVITPLFRRKNTCLGYGIPDLFGQMQKYSDKLDSIAMKNAAMSSHNKLLVTTMSGFDVDDLRDWSKEVHYGENLNGITWFANPPLPQYTVQAPGMIRQTIKEESGANDFSRGNTASGVTAASAIAALQEMSSKRSRMIAMQLHEAFKAAVRYEIEFEREYNVLPRDVQLTIDGQQVTATFESSLMERTSQLGNEIPIEFVISIKVQRENRWAVATQNELILQMVQLGIIQQTQAVELMEFEGKEEMLAKAAQAQQQVSPEEAQAQQQANEQQQLEQQMAALQAPNEGGNSMNVNGSPTQI